MARTVINPTILPKGYAVAPIKLTPLSAIDNVNGNSTPSTGREIIVVQNTDASAHTFTLSSTADAYGRTADLTQSLAAGDIWATQKVPADGWRQSDGNLYFTADSALVKVSVLQEPV